MANQRHDRNSETSSDAHTADPATLLLSAARLIERALIQLDMGETKCADCGGRHFHNRTHAKAYERLTNTPARLRGTVTLLTTGKDIDYDTQQGVDTTAEMLRGQR